MEKHIFVSLSPRLDLFASCAVSPTFRVPKLCSLCLPQVINDKKTIFEKDTAAVNKVG